MSVIVLRTFPQLTVYTEDHARTTSINIYMVLIRRASGMPAPKRRTLELHPAQKRTH